MHGMLRNVVLTLGMAACSAKTSGFYYHGKRGEWISERASGLPTARNQKSLKIDPAGMSFHLGSVLATRNEDTGALEPGWLGRQRYWEVAKHRNKPQDN